MYTIMFSGPGVAYAAKAKTKRLADSRIRELKRMRVPVVVLMWGSRPRAMYTLTPSGVYNRVLW